MSGHELTRLHRANLITLTGLVERDLATIWQQISTATDATVIRDQLADVLPQLVALYGAAAASLAADYYDEMRAQTELTSRFSAVVADTPNRDATDALAGFGVGPLFSAAPDSAAALTLVGGGLQRMVTNASRDTITTSATADPHDVIWVRIVYYGACGYCSSRGGTHDTSAHDHCHCGVEPRWS